MKANHKPMKTRLISASKALCRTSSTRYLPHPRRATLAPIKMIWEASVNLMFLEFQNLILRHLKSALTAKTLKKSNIITKYWTKS